MIKSSIKTINSASTNIYQSPKDNLQAFQAGKLSFNGATRYFKHNIHTNNKEISELINKRFKNSNGIIGTLPATLIKELKELSKTPEELAQNIKKIYKAFSNAVKKFSTAQTEITKTLDEIGITKNAFKYVEKIDNSSYGEVFKFKFGDKDFVIKVFKGFLGNMEEQSGNLFEQTRALFANKHKLKAFSTKLSYNGNTAAFLKHAKMFWSDLKSGYMISEFEKDTDTIFNKSLISKKGEFRLIPLSELHLGVSCEDINPNNVKNNTIIDFGYIFPRTQLDKNGRYMYKQLIKQIFTNTTPDKFIKDIIKKENELKKVFGDGKFEEKNCWTFGNREKNKISNSDFYDNNYVGYALINAFMHSKKESKNLFAQHASLKLKMTLIKQLNLLSSKQQLSLIKFIAKKMSKDIHEGLISELWKLNYDIREKAHALLFIQ